MKAQELRAFKSLEWSNKLKAKIFQSKFLKMIFLLSIQIFKNDFSSFNPIFLKMPFLLVNFQSWSNGS